MTSTLRHFTVSDDRPHVSLSPAILHVTSLLSLVFRHSADGLRCCLLMPETTVETSVLKQSRQACHKVSAISTRWLIADFCCTLLRAYSQVCLIKSCCAQARDAFFACVEGLGLEFTSDLPVPSSCSKTRAAYEKACLDSWVRGMPLAAAAAAPSLPLVTAVLSACLQH